MFSVKRGHLSARYFPDDPARCFVDLAVGLPSQADEVHGEFNPPIFKFVGFGMVEEPAGLRVYLLQDFIGQTAHVAVIEH